MKECCNNCKYNINHECTVKPLSEGIHPVIIPDSTSSYYRCSLYERKETRSAKLLVEDGNKK